MIPQGATGKKEVWPPATVTGRRARATVVEGCLHLLRMRPKPRRLSSVPPLQLRSIQLPKTPYTCLVCGKAVSDDVLVRVYIAPSDGSYRPGGGVPFVLEISPCCGDRDCVEAAWERAKAGVLGEIDEMELEPEDEANVPTEEPEPSCVEQALLDAKDEALIDEFLEWAAKSKLDPHDSWNLLPKFLEASKDFPKTRDPSLYYFGIGKPHAVTEKVKSLRDSIKKAVEGRDLKLAESLVPDCIAWASGLGLKTIRQADVEVFLSEKGVKMAPVAARALWARTGLQLRVGKGRA